MTIYESQIPATARPGQVAHFTSTGRFLRMESHVTSGLGMLFKVQQDGTLRRFFF